MLQLDSLADAISITVISSNNNLQSHSYLPEHAWGDESLVSISIPLSQLLSLRLISRLISSLLSIKSLVADLIGLPVLFSGDPKVVHSCNILHHPFNFHNLLNEISVRNWCPRSISPTISSPLAGPLRHTTDGIFGVGVDIETERPIPVDRVVLIKAKL